MKSIFGGHFGDYDYVNKFTEAKGYNIPYLHNAFVNFRLVVNSSNYVEKVFGAGEGMGGIRNGDKMQDRSYVLVDMADDQGNYSQTEVFGGGSNNGLGMNFTYAETIKPTFDQDNASAIVDLIHGNIKAVYGGAHNEGVTRRTVVNVPDNSDITIGNIFGGAFGTRILPPCDVLESNVNYNNTSELASVTGAIYGGNNSERRTLFAKVNISSPVWQDKENGYLATAYGAGKGIDTWAEHTEVNLLSGAKLYQVYGGGEMGHVLNAESVQKYMQLYEGGPSPQIASQDPEWDQRFASWADAWRDAWAIDGYYTPETGYTNYITNEPTNLTNISDRPELDEKTAALLGGKTKFNTNVIINEGASVARYAYGGGFGEAATHLSGDVYGTSYIALLGGTVGQDIYAAGTVGGVNDLFGAKTFTAAANAYIKGGTVRNVYGGGWLGNVGSHPGRAEDKDKGITADADDPVNDVPGATYVVIGDVEGSSLNNGVPAILRNAYGGGEGGAVFGTANLILNNGYVGYEYKDGTYKELTVDSTYVDKETKEFIPNNNLLKAGCLFGGGYIDNSSVDKTNVQIYGGTVRNSVFAAVR